MKKILVIISIFTFSFKLFAIEADPALESPETAFAETPKSKANVYPITSIEIMYFDHHKDYIPYPQLMEAKACLTKKDNVFTYDENQCTPIPLYEFDDLDEPEYFDKKALKEISKSLVQYFNKKGIHGVQVKVCYKQQGKFRYHLGSEHKQFLRFFRPICADIQKHFLQGLHRHFLLHNKHSLF